MSDDLLRLEEDPTLPESTGWRPTKPADADWALGRASELERLIAESEEMAAAAHQRIDERLAKTTAPLAKGALYLRACVEAWARENRAGLLVGKSKTRRLMNGSIAFRKNGGGLRVKDKAALLEWAKAQPAGLGLVRRKVEESPDVDAIKAHAMKNETARLIPPGMEWVEESETVQVVATGSELIEGGE